MSRVLVTGAGGAGRTTVAATTALHAARRGRRTLLLSTEPPGVLEALLGTAVPAEPAAGRPWTEPVRAAPGLWAARIDPGEEFRTRAAALQERGDTVFGLLGADPFDPEELTELPGSMDFALLRALRWAARGGTGPRPEQENGQGEPQHGQGDAAAAAAGMAARDWELVVVDMPPAPDTIRLLALPEQLRRYLRRLLPEERRAARALRPLLAQLAGMPMPAHELYEAAARWERELAAAQRVVASVTTTVRLVTDPGPVAAHTLRAARAGLALHGIGIEAVVANRLLPASAAHSADPWLRSLSGQQQTALKALRDDCLDAAIGLWELPHLGRDPLGRDALGELADLAGPVRPGGPSGSVSGGVSSGGMPDGSSSAGGLGGAASAGGSASVGGVGGPASAGGPDVTAAPGTPGTADAVGSSGVATAWSGVDDGSGYSSPGVSGGDIARGAGPGADGRSAGSGARLVSGAVSGADAGSAAVSEAAAGADVASAAASEAPFGARPQPWTVEDRLAEEGWLVWRMPLPGASREELGLVRRGDELIVSLGPFRRIMPLPSALRRCVIDGARLADGRLSVRFVPDPVLWPTG